MPLYQYKAFASDGKKRGGVVEADTFERAKEKLHSQNLLITEIQAAKSQKEPFLPPSMLLSFTRELSQLLNAGLPLYESLATIEEKYRKHRSHELFVTLCDQLKNGQQLSKILKAYPKTFDPIYLALVIAGEKTGALPWAFQQLYELVKKRQLLKKQLIGAMTYPLFLGIFCLVMVTGLLLFVIPSMQELFEGRAVHPLTQCTLTMSHFLREQGAILAASVLGFGFGLIYFLKKPQGKQIISRVAQKIPLVGTILDQAALVRFCKSSSVLLYGGVSLVNALEIARKSLNHKVYETIFQKAQKRVVEGEPLSVHLAKYPTIPTLVTRMLSIAEETGQMPKMFQSLSDIYDQELGKNLSHITTFIQPILLIIMGGLIGLIILSILLPMTDVHSFIQT